MPHAQGAALVPALRRQVFGAVFDRQRSRSSLRRRGHAQGRGAAGVQVRCQTLPTSRGGREAVWAAEMTLAPRVAVWLCGCTAGGPPRKQCSSVWGLLVTAGRAWRSRTWRWSRQAAVPRRWCCTAQQLATRRSKEWRCAADQARHATCWRRAHTLTCVCVCVCAGLATEFVTRRGVRRGGGGAHDGQGAARPASGGRRHVTDT